MPQPLTHFLPQEPEEAPKPAPTPKPPVDAEAEFKKTLEDQYGIDPEVDAKTPAPVVASSRPVVTSPTTETAPGAGDSKKYVHSPYRVELGKALGFDEEELSEMSPRILDKYAAQRIREQSSAPAPTQQPTPAERPVQAQPEPPKEPEITFDLGGHMIDEYDPETGEKTGKQIKAELKHYDPGLQKLFTDQQRQINTLTKQLEAVTGHLHGQEVQKFASRVDTFFSRSPEFYGEGARADLDDKSPEVQRRQAILQTAQTIAKQHKELRIKSSMEQHLEQAHTALFGNVALHVAAPSSRTTPPSTRRPTPPKDPATGLFVKVPTTPAPEPEEDDEEDAARKAAWVRGGVAQPTNRESPELPKGEKRAVQVLRRRQAEAQLNGDGHDDEDDV